MSGLDQLNTEQRRLLAEWLPDAQVVADHSWGLVGTSVLELRTRTGGHYIAKAGDENDHHLARELTAHRQWLGPWVSGDRAPSLVAADADAKLLVTRFLPGQLVEGTPHEHVADTYRQAGELLARFHHQLQVHDDGSYERAQSTEVLGWLDRPHRIAAGDVALLRDAIRSWPTTPAALVPTHGDWQPRNWLIHAGTIRVIDFGRAALRPAMSDLVRLAARQFREDPSLEAAFLDGYGTDPREPDAWFRLRVREAVATAGWALMVGDEQFERQGLRMVDDVLAELRSR